MFEFLSKNTESERKERDNKIIQQFEQTERARRQRNATRTATETKRLDALAKANQTGGANKKSYQKVGGSTESKKKVVAKHLK